MILFEDSKDDLLSVLYRAVYVSEVDNSFAYSDGNGALIQKAENLLKQGADRIYVFMDMIPGNLSIHKVYYGLKRVVKKYLGRIWVLPVVCAEYYFIEAFHETQFLVSDVGVETVLSKGDYSQSLLISDESERKFAKNFEKFCKLVLNKCYIDCIKHTRGINNTNSCYGVFYKEDCKCGNSCINCREQSVLEKSEKFVKTYPCHVYNPLIGDARKMTDEEVCVMHRSLVDSYNLWVSEYNKTNRGIEIPAKSIDYIH